MSRHLERRAKKAAVVGAGVGEDVLSVASTGAKVLHLPHQTIDSRLQELKDDNADNPGLRTTGRIAGAVVPALATGIPQAAARVGAAGVEGISEGALDELAKHGLDAKGLLGAAVKKGGRTYVLNQLGTKLGLSREAIAVLDAISAAL